MKKIFFLIGVSLLFACNDQQKVRKNAASQNELLSVTGYSNKHELFINYRSLVVNKTASFIIYLSQLHPHIKPVAGAIITPALLINQKGVKTTAVEKSPGVYAFSLKPMEPGNADLYISIKSDQGDEEIIIKNLEVYKDLKNTQAKAIFKEDNKIHLSKKQIWNLNIACEPAALHAMNSVIKAYGQIIAAPGQQFTIAANASGIVQFIQRNLTIGSAVQGGRELFRISGADLNTGTNIDIEIQQAKFEASIAEDAFNRAKQLMEDYLITKDKYQQVLLQYQNSRLKLDHLRKNYAHSGKKLAASTAGFINSVLVQEGDYVTAGQPLATISKNQRVLLQVNVPLRESNNLQSIQEANFILQQGLQVYNTASFNGKMVSVAKTSFENTPWVALYFEIDNNAEWIPGSYADVFLKTNKMENVLAIPSDAILEDQGHYYVYIQIDAENFIRREVEPGTNDGQLMEIKNGISPGENLVVKGAYQIKLASTVSNSNIHDHAH